MPDFRTETQKVTDELREAILGGVHAPGDRLPQRTVAGKYGTTTIVAREALRFLAGEGLVLIEPRYGAMVEEVTPERLQERYLVREALEGMAARLAAEHLTDGQRETLGALADSCDRDLRADSLSRHEKAELHIRLHEFIAEVAHCGELARLLKSLYLHSMIVSNAYHVDWRDDRVGWHRTLVRPILDRNPEQAEAVMRNHVRRGFEMELAAIKTPV